MTHAVSSAVPQDQAQTATTTTCRSSPTVSASVTEVKQALRQLMETTTDADRFSEVAADVLFCVWTHQMPATVAEIHHAVMPKCKFEGCTQFARCCGMIEALGSLWRYGWMNQEKNWDTKTKKNGTVAAAYWFLTKPAPSWFVEWFRQSRMRKTGRHRGKLWPMKKLGQDTPQRLALRRALALREASATASTAVTTEDKAPGTKRKQPDEEEHNDDFDGYDCMDDTPDTAPGHDDADTADGHADATDDYTPDYSNHVQPCQAMLDIRLHQKDYTQIRVIPLWRQFPRSSCVTVMRSSTPSTWSVVYEIDASCKTRVCKDRFGFYMCSCNKRAAELIDILRQPGPGKHGTVNVGQSREAVAEMLGPPCLHVIHASNHGAAVGRAPVPPKSNLSPGDVDSDGLLTPCTDTTCRGQHQASRFYQISAQDSAAFDNQSADQPPGQTDQVTAAIQPATGQPDEPAAADPDQPAPDTAAVVSWTLPAEVQEPGSRAKKKPDPVAVYDCETQTTVILRWSWRSRNGRHLCSVCDAGRIDCRHTTAVAKHHANSLASPTTAPSYPAAPPPAPPSAATGATSHHPKNHVIAPFSNEEERAFCYVTADVLAQSLVPTTKGTCPQCNNKEKPTVLSEKNATLYHMGGVREVTVQTLQCKKCRQKFHFGGQSVFAVSAASSLVGYDILRDHLFSMVSGERSLAGSCGVWNHRHETDEIKLTEQHFRVAWGVFAGCIDLTRLHTVCPMCGLYPTRLFCDGTRAGFNLKNADELQQRCRDAVGVAPASSHVGLSYHGRTLLSSVGGALRNQLVDLLAAEAEDADLPALRKRLRAVIQKMPTTVKCAPSLREALTALASESHPQLWQPFAAFVRQLCLNTSCHSLFDIRCLASSRVGPLVERLAEGAEVELEDKRLAYAWSPLLRLLTCKLDPGEVVPAVIGRALHLAFSVATQGFDTLPIEAASSAQPPLLEPTIPTNSVWRQQRVRPYFPLDKGTKKYRRDATAPDTKRDEASAEQMDESSCQKTFAGHDDKTGASFLFVCEHAFVYSNSLLLGAESPLDPATVLYEYLPQDKQTDVIYDHACALQRGVENRFPQMLANVAFFTDPFHDSKRKSSSKSSSRGKTARGQTAGGAHSRCAAASCWRSFGRLFKAHNAEAQEQINSRYCWLLKAASSMSVDTFRLHARLLTAFQSHFAAKRVLEGMHTGEALEQMQSDEIVYNAPHIYPQHTLQCLQEVGLVEGEVLSYPSDEYEGMTEVWFHVSAEPQPARAAPAIPVGGAGPQIQRSAGSKRRRTADIAETAVAGMVVPSGTDHMTPPSNSGHGLAAAGVRGGGGGDRGGGSPTGAIGADGVAGASGAAVRDRTKQPGRSSDESGQRRVNRGIQPAVAGGWSRRTTHVAKNTTSKFQQLDLDSIAWDKMRLSRHQTAVADSVLRAFADGSGGCLVTGGAGTGKSFVCKAVTSHLQSCGLSVWVTGATGVAAALAGGTTLHHFAGILPNLDPTQTVIQALRIGRVRERIGAADVILVDEVSQLGVTFDAFCEILLKLRGEDQPKLLFSGDFYQLPGVGESNGAQAPYAFESDHWSHIVGDNSFELTEVQRQADPFFVEILNIARTMGPQIDLRVQQFLEGRQGVSLPSTTIQLHPLRTPADKANQDARQRLHLAERQRYFARDEGATNSWQRGPKLLELRVGMPVLLRANVDVEDGLYNGAMGVVAGFQQQQQGSKEKLPIIEFRREDGVQSVVVGRHVTTRHDSKGNVIASRTQIPLIEAAAVTIHLVQGSSLQAAVVHLEGLFAPGQGYSALARVVDSEKLQIGSLPNKWPEPPQAVKTFYAKLAERRTDPAG
eukprot:m.408652 g.408652  ORF g.408652 m.408652 type:complete len:1830 (-) comp20149_c1_seq2:471-5960(-)